MSPRAWLGVAILLIWVGSACTPNGPLGRGGPPPLPGPPPGPPSQAASPSREPATPAPQPTPIPVSISCSTTPSPASQPLVLAWTADRQQVVVDSFRDPAHPATLCTMSGIGIVRFISGSEIGYVSYSS